MNRRFLNGLLLIATFAMSQALGGVYVRFDPQGGSFDVTGVTMNSGAIPDEVMRVYPDPVRIGHNFCGWSSIADPQNDNELQRGFAAYYSTPVTKVTTFYAIWEQYAPDPLDLNGEWTFANGEIHGVITNGFWMTRCTYAAPGRGWVSFKWRLVSADDESVEIGGYGYESDCSVWTGRAYQTLKGYEIYHRPNYMSAGWQTARIPVKDGAGSDVVWQLTNDYGDSYGRPELQVKDIVWESVDNAETTIRLELCGGALVDETSLVRVGMYGKLPEPEREGCRFVGWSESTYSHGASVSSSQLVTEDSWLPLETNVTLYAVWDVPAVESVDPLRTLRDSVRGNSLELGSFSYTNVYSNWSWLYEYDYDEAGNHVWNTGRSRVVWAGEYLSWQMRVSPDKDYEVLHASVHGCGTLHFTECWTSTDYLSIYIDGELCATAGQSSGKSINDLELEIRQKGGPSSARTRVELE